MTIFRSTPINVIFRHFVSYNYAFAQGFQNMNNFILFSQFEFFNVKYIFHFYLIDVGSDIAYASFYILAAQLSQVFL